MNKRVPPYPLPKNFNEVLIACGLRPLLNQHLKFLGSGLGGPFIRNWLGCSQRRVDGLGEEKKEQEQGKVKNGAGQARG